MKRGDIVDLLTDLGARLSAQGLTGEMYVVGGAAIALAFDARRATRDIDSVFEPKAKIYEIADRMAEERGLDEGWLNDAVKGFMVGPDPEASTVLDVPGLSVSVASPRILLAMKVAAHRTGEDEDDVRLLARHLSLDDADSVLDAAEETLTIPLPTGSAFFVEAIFDTGA